MLNIPFGDLKRNYQSLQTEIDAMTKHIYETGWFVLGKEGERFEQNFANYCGAKYAVGVGSGTEALHLALLAIGIKTGDEVITVANTCVPTITAVTFAQANPIFIDINPQTYTIDIKQIETRITDKTKAILPVHLYGQCAEMNPILQLAQQYDLMVIEDCAQAHGACYLGQKAGTMGDAGCYSFYPSKNLGCFGDGGMVVTNDESIAEKVRQLRNYGQRERYYHSIKGFNSRLDELQAGILNVKLPHLDRLNNRRREIAEKYHQLLQKFNITCPQNHPDCYHVYHLYVIRVKNRELFQQLLVEKGINTLIHYPIPVHLQDSYPECRLQSEYLPITEKFSSEIVSLPLYPDLTDEEVDYILEVLNDILSSQDFSI